MMGKHITEHLHQCLRMWQRSTRRIPAWLLGILLAGAVILPLATGNPYYLHVSVLIMVYMVLALGLNVIVSCGLLDLGYIAFFAIGAYSYAILNTRWHVSFWATLPVAVVLCMVAGVILAVVSLRSRSDYFALLTLAFGEIVRLILRNADSLTNGPQGIMNIERPDFLWPMQTPLHFYYFALVWLVAVFFVVHRVTVSRVGASWVGVRDNEIWLASTGYHVLAVKVSACVLGAVIAGVSGVFFAAWQTFVAPESFVFLESILVLCMVVLGGGVQGNLAGVLLGAMILGLLPELLREFQSYRMIVLGAGMTLIAVFKSSGLISQSWWANADRRLFRRRARVPLDRSVHDPESPTFQSISLVLMDLRKSFDGLVALGSRDKADHAAGAGFSFDFRPYTTYGIVGLNGAGKTTLFNCIRGFCTPDSGEIRVGDSVVYSRKGKGGALSFGARFLRRLWPRRKLQPHRAARFLGTTFQTCSNQENMPAWKNVFLALRPLDSFGAVFDELVFSLIFFGRAREVRDKERAVKFLKESLGFPETALETTVHELSFAERRTVEIAKAFAPGKPIILLDEPTAGLSEAERLQFVEIIKTLSKGRTVVVIEHNHSILERMSDRVLFMEDGNIGVEDGQPIVGDYASVMRSRHVRDVYLGSGLAREPRTAPVAAAEPILDVQIERAGYIEGGAVLADVAFTIPRGSIIGLAGLNGAGKTTLLRCLINSAELPWLKGRIDMKTPTGQWRLVDPVRSRSLPTYRIARAGLLLVRQEQKMFGTMSVEENLRAGTIGRSRQFKSRADAATRWFCEEILVRAFTRTGGDTERGRDRFWQELLSRRASQLSGGQQQLLAIGRAFIGAGIVPGASDAAGNDVMILLDEPTSGLQPSLAHVVFETVNLLRDAYGISFLVTEQGVQLSQVVDVAYRMENGRLKSE